jgi:hypothetical protein
MSAPILAASEPVAAVVLLAAPGRPLNALLREQLLYARELAGATPGELEAFGQEIDGFLEAIARGDQLAAEGIPPELAAFLPARAWLESHLALDPLANVKRVRQPVLILQGAKDIQVSAERDTPLLVLALEEAGHADHELHVFPTLDHLFKKSPGERSSGLDYLLARPVDAEFLDVLAAWLRARLID